jgi:hypothetical protein
MFLSVFVSLSYGAAVVNQAILAWLFKKVPYFFCKMALLQRNFLKNLYLVSTYVVPTIKK